jgi:hypothetical protein
MLKRRMLTFAISMIALASASAMPQLNASGKTLPDASRSGGKRRPVPRHRHGMPKVKHKARQKHRLARLRRRRARLNQGRH